MGEAIKLMENTKVKTFSVYNDGVFKRNRRDFRVVSPDEITEAMCKSAGVSPEWATVTKEVKKAEPVKAPDVVEPTSDIPADLDEWDEKTLKEYAQDKDIPTHPAARKPGLIAAITRHYKELAKSGEED
jgi:hypothetical protein